MPPVAAKRIGATRPRHRRRRRTPAPGAARPEPVKPDPVAPVEPVSPETLRAHWRIAFDAAQAALRAGRLYLTATELGAHAAELVAERERTSRLLKAYARDHRGGAPVLPGVHTLSQARRMLGLPPEVTACVFSLDGILIGSAAVHAAAWTETFDELISARVERTGGLFAPFNPRIDYRAHIHGKPRLDGVRAFLSSRGISLPEGHPDDAPGTETVHGIANRKNAALLRLLDRQGLTAFAGAHEYLVIARDADVSRAVVSASANTDTILERAGLSSLIDGSIDGNAIVAEQLHPRPAPDILLAACRRLGTEPRHTAVFETSPAGIVAARTAGFGFVVGVDRSGEARALVDAGADLVVGGLDDLLERRRAA